MMNKLLRWWTTSSSHSIHHCSSLFIAFVSSLRYLALERSFCNHFSVLFLFFCFLFFRHSVLVLNRIYHFIVFFFFFSYSFISFLLFFSFLSYAPVISSSRDVPFLSLSLPLSSIYMICFYWILYFIFYYRGHERSRSGSSINLKGRNMATI